jgi:hypothetical protein
MTTLRYTLRRLNWRKAGGGPYDRGVHGWYRLPGTTRVAVFEDADSAERERRRLEGEVRKAINPFLCGTSLADRSSLDEGRLCDWLLDLGLEPPALPRAAKQRDWATWWNKAHEHWDDHQLKKVWEALDRLRFYEVIEGPVRPLVYVVVAIAWHYTDQDYFAGEEGGAPHRVFRTRAEAEAFCKDKHARFSNEPFDMTSRLRLQADPLELEPPGEEVWFDDGHAPLYDILEVEVMD